MTIAIANATNLFNPVKSDSESRQTDQDFVLDSLDVPVPTETKAPGAME
jgi:hypothetical protein